MFAVTGTNAELTYDGGSLWAPNLPAGLTHEAFVDFDEWPAEGLFDSANRWSRFDGSQVAADASFDTEDGDNVAQTNVPGNSRGGGFGELSIESRTLPNGGAKQLYVAFDLWVSSNYIVHDGGEKLWYPLVVEEVLATDVEMIPPAGGNGDEATYRFRVFTGVDGEDWRYSTGTCTKGQGHHIEIYMVMNTPGNANGIWRVWIDGVQAANETDVTYWDGGSQEAWDIWRFNSTRGGGDSSLLTPAGGQKRQYSPADVYISASLP